jgi:hypothetical protein
MMIYYIQIQFVAYEQKQLYMMIQSIRKKIIIKYICQEQERLQHIHKKTHTKHIFQKKLSREFSLLRSGMCEKHYMMKKGRSRVHNNI